MRLLRISTLWRLCKWIAYVSVVYAIVKTGISPSIICLPLTARLLIRLGLQLVGGMVKIAFAFIILWLITLVF